MFVFSTTKVISSISGFKVKLTALAVIAVLNSACDSGSSSSEVVPNAGQSPELANPDAINPDTINPDAIGAGPTGSAVLTGVFIDSPVANLSFTTQSGSDKTNEHGEFFLSIEST